ncbi:MAG: hypothetical protein ACRCWM_04770 [Sarcina sp.]
MNKQQLQQYMGNFNTEDCTLSFVLGHKKRNGYNFKTMGIHNNLQPEVLSMLLDKTNTIINICEVKGFNSFQQELEVSKEKNDKKIDKANEKISTTRIKEQIKDDEVPSCSKCGSKHITAQKQGFGIGKAVVGVVALGPVGSLAGGINKNKIELTCLKCGHKFKIKRCFNI